MSDSPPIRDRFLWAFLFSALCALVPLWSVKYPPMVDLPQHAAQVFLWKHFDDPAHDFSETYWLKYSSPYFIGYALARFFAVLLPVPAAMKAVVTLVLVGLPLALERLLAAAGADRWWSLLGFPLAYGFAFHWGFLNYLVAVPVAVAFIHAGWSYARAPSRRRGLLLVLFALVLYLCHALAFGIAVASVGALILGSVPGPRQKALALLPLVPPVVVIGIWVFLLRGGDPSTTTPSLWSEPPWQRLYDLPSILLGGGRTKGAWWIGGFLLLVFPFAFGTPRRRPFWRWLPLLAALAVYFAMPNRTLGTWFVYPRLALFIPILSLTVTAPARSALRRRLGRIFLLGFVAGWMVFLTVQFRPIDAEGRRFDDLLERMEPDKSVLGLIFEPGTSYGAGVPVFGHHHAWYQAQKGGRAEHSFAMAFPQLVQYLPGRGPLASPDLALRPDRFTWRRDGRFDYFLVRADRDPAPLLFRDATSPVVLEGHSGWWWLFRREM